MVAPEAFKLISIRPFSQGQGNFEGGGGTHTFCIIYKPPSSFCSVFFFLSESYRCKFCGSALGAIIMAITIASSISRSQSYHNNCVFTCVCVFDGQPRNNDSTDWVDFSQRSCFRFDILPRSKMAYTTVTSLHSSRYI